MYSVFICHNLADSVLCMGLWRDMGCERVKLFSPGIGRKSSLSEAFSYLGKFHGKRVFRGFPAFGNGIACSLAASFFLCQYFDPAFGKEFSGSCGHSALPVFFVRFICSSEVVGAVLFEYLFHLYAHPSSASVVHGFRGL